MLKHLYNQRWRLAVVLIFVSFSSILKAQPLPAGFSVSKLLDGFVQPVGTVFSSDGLQLFIWEKSGRIVVSSWNGTAYAKQTAPVLDIAEEVGDWRDLGLLSVCLDPNFRDNGFIYLFYVVDRHHLLYYGTPQYSPTANEYNNATISRVTRYRISNAGGIYTADPASRKVLIGETKTTGVPLTHESHAGGTLLFGRDGSLLISTGDHASYASTDIGSAPETYYQTALAEGMMRAQENVGSFRAQMVNSLCGKVLRIDPTTGNGLTSNPFFESANPRSARSRVWTLGLRNPFQMTLQPNTGSTNSNDGNPGTIVLGDVGWATTEELHVINQAGLNCGWPLYEGLETAPKYYNATTRNLDEAGQPTFVSLCRQPTSTSTDANPANRRFTHARPVLDWMHTVANAGVPAFNGSTPVRRTLGTAGAPAGASFAGTASMGGAFYTGSQFPASYQNTYFLADFGANWIKNIVLTGNSSNPVGEVREFAPNDFGNGIVDLKMNPRDGSLVYLNIYTKQLMRIGYGGNQPPTARLSSDLASGPSPLRVRFSSAGSTDPEGQPLTYRWDFGDGTTSTEANPEHVFTATTSRGFTVSLMVTDKGQLSDTKQLLISTNNTAPSVRIISPVDGTLYPMDKASYYQLMANVTDNDKANLKYEWQVSLYHNTHHHDEPLIYEASPTVEISPVGCTSSETYHYQITLKVTDNGGLTAVDSTRLYADCKSILATVSNVTTTSQPNAIRIDWQNPSTPFDEIMVVARAGEDISDHPAGTAYTADANFSGKGSPLGGGKVVYRSVGNTVTVTNLTPGTLYTFRLYTRLVDVWSTGVKATATPAEQPLNQPVTAPTIGVQPIAAGPVCATGSVTLVTSASAPKGSLTYQWQSQTNGNWTNLSNGSGISGATTASLTVGSPALVNGLTLRTWVTVTDGVTTSSATSNPVSLTVVSGPAITTQPTNQQGCFNSSTVFSVVASGGGLLYQWETKESATTGTWSSVTNGSDASGSTTAQLTVSNGLVTNGRLFRVRVYSGTCSGPVYSYTVNLAVKGPLVFTQQPTSVNMCPTGTARFTMGANNNGSGIIAVRWEYRDGSGWAAATGAGFSGGTTGTLYVNSAQLVNGRRFRVVISSTACSAELTSQEALLSVSPTFAPAVTGVTASQTITSGQSIQGITATGSGGTGTLQTAWSRTSLGALTFTPALAASGTSADFPLIRTISSTSTVNQTLTFTLKVTDSWGCYQTALTSVTVRPAPGASRVAHSGPGSSDELMVYPNPFDGRVLQVRGQWPLQTQFRLYNTLGIEVPLSLQAVESGGVNLYPPERLPSGLYLLWVQEDERSQYRKVLVE